jgi:hypothetical protein
MGPEPETVLDLQGGSHSDRENALGGRSSTEPGNAETTLLTSRIPNLQPHSSILEVQRLGQKVHANGCLRQSMRHGSSH